MCVKGVSHLLNFIYSLYCYRFSVAINLHSKNNNFHIFRALKHHFFHIFPTINSCYFHIFPNPGAKAQG